MACITHAVSSLRNGVTNQGNRSEILVRKGEWKIRPSNPRRRDGYVHEYCPPEQVASEIENFSELRRRNP
ncbi:MAG: hypothetical protein OXC63_08490 [Aestuariivita sp.]|nr:hypothetical protein [Aestuariivita sp.]MCY4345428.1 hypothetical protein [Aestuariivita sp.]